MRIIQITTNFNVKSLKQYFGLTKVLEECGNKLSCTYLFVKTLDLLTTSTTASQFIHV